MSLILLPCARDSHGDTFDLESCIKKRTKIKQKIELNIKTSTLWVVFLYPPQTKFFCMGMNYPTGASSAVDRIEALIKTDNEKKVSTSVDPPTSPKATGSSKARAPLPPPPPSEPEVSLRG